MPRPWQLVCASCSLLMSLQAAGWQQIRWPHALSLEALMPFTNAGLSVQAAAQGGVQHRQACICSSNAHSSWPPLEVEGDFVPAARIKEVG